MSGAASGSNTESSSTTALWEQDIDALFAGSDSPSLANCSGLVELLRSWVVDEAEVTHEHLDSLIVAALSSARRAEPKEVAAREVPAQQERQQLREGARGFLFLSRDYTHPSGDGSRPIGPDLEFATGGKEFTPSSRLQRKAWAALLELREKNNGPGASGTYESLYKKVGSKKLDEYVDRLKQDLGTLIRKPSAVQNYLDQWFRIEHQQRIDFCEPSLVVDRAINQDVIQTVELGELHAKLASQAACLPDKDIVSQKPAVTEKNDHEVTKIELDSSEDLAGEDIFSELEPESVESTNNLSNLNEPHPVLVVRILRSWKLRLKRVTRFQWIVSVIVFVVVVWGVVTIAARPSNFHQIQNVDPATVGISDGYWIPGWGPGRDSQRSLVSEVSLNSFSLGSSAGWPLETDGSFWAFPFWDTRSFMYISSDSKNAISLKTLAGADPGKYIVTAVIANAGKQNIGELRARVGLLSNRNSSGLFGDTSPSYSVYLRFTGSNLDPVWDGISISPSCNCSVNFGSDFKVISKSGTKVTNLTNKIFDEDGEVITAENSKGNISMNISDVYYLTFSIEISRR